MTAPQVGPPRVLITGASGYIGSLLVAELSRTLASGRINALVATDIRSSTSSVSGLPSPVFFKHDIRDNGLAVLLRRHAIDCVIHLASIVTPSKGSTREFEYSVDVGGTRRVLDACIQAGVRRIVVTSSGAAYGYHADNPEWITEDAPLRGNESFAYSWHKRLVEEMLAAERKSNPALEQVIFRVGTILGESVNNQITALFERPRVLVIRRSASPFVFINDHDVVNCLVKAIDSTATGAFNVAGDGALPLREIAALLGKPTIELPSTLVRAALAVAHPLGLTRYGAAQVDFLRYRPVLDNRRLKEVFGYTPAMTTRQAFLHWAEQR